MGIDAKLILMFGDFLLLYGTGPCQQLLADNFPARRDQIGASGKSHFSLLGAAVNHGGNSCGASLMKTKTSE